MYREVEKICGQVLDEIKQPADWFSQLPQERKTLVKSYFEQDRGLSLAGQANMLCRLSKSEEAIPIYNRVIEGRQENVEQNPEIETLAINLRSNYATPVLGH